LATEITTAIDRRSGAAHVSAAGDLDLGSAHRLRDAIVEAWEVTRQPVAVHLGGVRFFDSFGLHAVVTAWRVISADGGQLYVAATSGPVRRVLAVTGTDVLLIAPVGAPERPRRPGAR
jgi:anti-sigma B factor antagonist